jgi:hypothetical protein
MTYPLASDVIELLGPRKLRIEPVRTLDGRAVWRGAVRSIRRVVWAAEARDLAELFELLGAWLEAQSHRDDCRCRDCRGAK